MAFAAYWWQKMFSIIALSTINDFWMKIRLDILASLEASWHLN